jgi:serine/threonine protein kinase
VYGLGATLYKVVTGNPPIVGSNALETVQNVATQQPAQPQEINSNVSEDLSLVIMKSLDKNHHRRYASMEMFSEDLGRILEGRAPLARLNHPRSKQSHVSVFQRFSGVVSTVIFGSNKSIKDSAGTEP